MQNKSVIFTHILKTAGTSVMNELVYPNYTGEEIRRFWGGFGIKKLILTNTSNYKIFTGHFPYGIHHFIRQDCEYFTFLREPIARAISHYNFIKNNQARYIENKNKYQEYHQKHSLEDIFDKELGLNPFKGVIIDNMQTRILAGYYNYFLPKNSTRLLNTAKKNLKNKYKIFGLQERFDESVQLVADTFDWDRKDLGIHQKKTFKKDPVSDDTLKVLQNNHLLDIELYNYAKELFNQQLG